MKKLLILSFVFIMSAGATFAQDKMASKQEHMSKMHKPMKDCVIMKDGKMWTMKGGKTMEMTQPATMNNGTTVMADGTVKTKEGKTMMMKEGDCMYMSGKMKKMMKKKGSM